MNKRFLRSVSARLGKLVPTGTPLKILRGPLRGARWIAGAAAGEGKGLSPLLNWAEPEQLETARKPASPDTACFAIGANVGFHSLLFARYAGHVYAFEPLLRNLRYLTSTLRLNKVDNVTVVPWAVSDCFGLASFEEGENCATGRLSRGKGQPVVAVPLDMFVAFYAVVPAVIKVDVEGAEVRVLEGARELLSAHRPSILLSTHGQEPRQKCLDLLRSLGYTRFLPLDSPAGSPAQAVDFVVLP